MPAKPSPDTPSDPFAKLTWDDLDEWAGSKIVQRGKGYQRSGAVKGLARTPEGWLVATVYGTDTYRTRVSMRGDRLSAQCTCPYDWGTCKHAVAVVLEYLECLKQGRSVPTPTTADERAWDLVDDDDLDGDLDSTDDMGVAVPTAQTASDELVAYLDGLTKEQLVELTTQLAAAHSSVRTALTHQVALDGGDSDRMVAALRAEIDELASQHSRTDSWHDEGHVPDYSSVRERMEQLLTAGHADALLVLGSDLLEQGAGQVEESNDEGEVAGEIAECLEIVFRALPQSSLPPSEQLLWAIDAERADDYDLVHVPDEFWEEGKTPADWNAVAGALTTRLDQLPAPRDGFADGYRRDGLSNWLISALEHANRDDEILPLCEKEAPLTGSYVRLVDRLLRAERYDEAEKRVSEGLAAVGDRLGVRRQLEERLRLIATSTGDAERVAALRAHESFETPTLEGYNTLLAAAQELGIRDEVRKGALRLLETGKRPDQGKGKRRTKAWPLRPAGLPASESGPHPSALPLLMDIAFAEERPDDALGYYDRLCEQTPFSGDWIDKRVGVAVADSHPERAVEILRTLAERQINRTQVSTYPIAAGHLRRVRDILQKLGRSQEWETYLAALRETHKRKVRFIEALDRMDGAPIVES